MRTAHAIVKLLALVLITTAFYLILLLGRLVLLFSPERRRLWRNYMVGSWARSCAPVIRMSIRTLGVVPKAPGFLVCNHLSYMDIPLLFTQLGCTFVAKSELASWPVMGFLIKSVNTLFIDRNRKRDIPRVNELIARTLKSNSLIAMFPEGTSSKGATVLPFKPSLLEHAAQMGLPVYYATLHYETFPPDVPAHLSVCWWGDMTFPDHLFRLLKLRRIDARIEFGPHPVRNEDRKQLATELWELMSRQLLPVTDEDPESEPPSEKGESAATTVQ